jgi:hypothetical protein
VVHGSGILREDGLHRLFNAGVRALDIRDPYHPTEVGIISPSPPLPTSAASRSTQDRCKTAIQTNNVETDARGTSISSTAPTRAHILELTGAARAAAGGQVTDAERRTLIQASLAAALVAGSGVAALGNWLREWQRENTGWHRSPAVPARRPACRARAREAIEVMCASSFLRQLRDRRRGRRGGRRRHRHRPVDAFVPLRGQQICITDLRPRTKLPPQDEGDGSQRSPRRCMAYKCDLASRSSVMSPEPTRAAHQFLESNTVQVWVALSSTVAEREAGAVAP